MSRIPELTAAELTPAQQSAHAIVGKTRAGSVRGPFAIWLRHPAIAERAGQLGDALRVEGLLDKRLFELAVLLVARRWSAQYQWHTHAGIAETLGLAHEVIEAIRTGQKPSLDGLDAVVYAVTTELTDTGRLGDETFAAAEKALGRETLIELVATIGFYTMVSFTLNAYDVPTTDGSTPLK